MRASCLPKAIKEGVKELDKERHNKNCRRQMQAARVCIEGDQVEGDFTIAACRHARAWVECVLHPCKQVSNKKKERRNEMKKETEKDAETRCRLPNSA